jgi:hypothetical protein
VLYRAGERKMKGGIKARVVIVMFVMSPLPFPFRDHDEHDNGGAECESIDPRGI